MTQTMPTTASMQAEIERLRKSNAALLYSTEEMLEHIEWRRRGEGRRTGPNDCTHRAQAAITEARAAGIEPVAAAVEGQPQDDCAQLTFGLIEAA